MQNMIFFFNFTFSLYKKNLKNLRLSFICCFGQAMKKVSYNVLLICIKLTVLYFRILGVKRWEHAQCQPHKCGDLSLDPKTHVIYGCIYGVQQCESIIPFLLWNVVGGHIGESPQVARPARQTCTAENKGDCLSMEGKD